MLYAIVKPREKTVEKIEAKTLEVVLAAAGLQPGKVDHGLIHRQLGIVVYEFGMFTPPERQSYFAIDRRLYAGTAVLYGIDWAGKEIAVTILPDVRWFASTREVEVAIEADEIVQPSVKIGDEVVWVWPQPVPQSLVRGVRSLLDV